MRKVIVRAAGRGSRAQASTNAKRIAGARAGLAREGLVDAALALLQEGGLAALSTRNLAARLGVQSPALYWHMRDKQELLGLVADAICAGMRLPDESTTYRARLEAIAAEYRRVLMKYRDAPRLFAELAPTGPHRIALYDAAVGAFLASGLAPPDAIAMATFYRNFLLGMIAEEARQAVRATAGTLRPAQALGVELAHLGDDAQKYRHLRGAAVFLADIDPDASFRLGVSVLLDGVDSQSSHARRSQAQPLRRRRTSKTR